MALPTKSECESFAERNYDWSVVGPQIRKVYEEAMGGDLGLWEIS